MARIWFLWCGRNSPFSARITTTAFERLLVEDESTHKEARNAYYKVWQNEDLAKKVLSEFGLFDKKCRIINGHIPQKAGECPVKANGRVIVIDGGFCRAYHKKCGIAGYTLIQNSMGMRLSAHKPFLGKEAAVRDDADIFSESIPISQSKRRIKVRECDRGEVLRDRVADLLLLLRERGKRI